MKGQTDWDEYYKKPKSIFSTITQKATLEKIKECISKYAVEKKTEVMELGGGNSCFAVKLCKDNDEIIRYDIADNNHYAVSLFEMMEFETNHRGIEIDLAKEQVNPYEAKYDFVYSVGLIEHFSPDERAKVIASHFNLCKDGGIVLISFPTPTRKYLLVRKLMEMIGAWQFWDETPLVFDQVKEDLEKHGKILSKDINRKLPLSQMITVVRKNEKCNSTNNYE